VALFLLCVEGDEEDGARDYFTGKIVVGKSTKYYKIDA
jgi:hypothetical protein